MLQAMRKRRVSHIVQQDCNQSTIVFAFGNLHTLLPQHLQRLHHKVHCTQRMRKPAVFSPRINKVAKPQLLDTAKPLHKRTLYNVKQLLVWNVDKTIYGVVDYLFLVLDVHFSLQSYYFAATKTKTRRKKRKLSPNQLFVLAK